jgi:hypothetical protein
MYFNDHENNIKTGIVYILINDPSCRELEF